MTDTPVCPTCRTPVPAGSPGGACPRCLLAAGLESGGAAERAAPPPPEEMNRHFPQMEVLEVLGQGGMGIVYRARHRNLDRMVALKVLPPEAAREPGFPERFTREARTLARLQHPHIVGVHDFGETGGLYYLVMEFVDGPNLRQVIREGSLDPKQALAIVPQVCDALQYAHDQGVVHRDIKPENILLDREGRVKIADFGLAKIVQRAPMDLTLTREGQVMGTLHYMAPEQYRSPDTVDHRADIFSLGVVFYEMLTGELPMGVFPPPSRKQGVDARLDVVVMRALEKERDARWQHASEMRTRVDTIAAGAEPAANPPPGTPDAAPPAPARRVPAPVAPLSRTAVLSGLGLPLSLGLAAVAWAVTEALTHGAEEDILCPRVAALVFGGSLIVTTFLGIASWLRIRASAGALRGLGWAVTGSLLSPFALFLGFPGMVLLRKVDPVRILDLRMERIPPSAPAGTRGRAHSVLGGPFQMTELQREWVVREMDDLWRSQGPGLLHQMYESGEEGRLPSAWSVQFVRMAPDGWSGRVVVSDGKNTMAFPVLHDRIRWTVPEGDREARPGAPENDDRDGRLHDATREVPSTEEAALVTVAPARMTTKERADLVAALRRRWQVEAEEWLRRNFPGTGRETRARTMRLFAVALRADGLVGRMVLTDESTTVAVTAAPGLGIWGLQDEGAEWADRPAGDADRDGFLFR